MHHKYDASRVVNMAASIFFFLIFSISYEAAKRRFCHLTFPPLKAHFFFLRIIFPSPCIDMCKQPAAVLGGGNLSQKRRKSEPEEEEK